MPKRDKTDVSGGSSRPASAQHKSKRNNPDLRDSTDVEPSFAESEAHGQAKAEENGQAESGGGEDIDSDDEDYEETHGDDDDCGYNEEEYKSDPDAYDASLSFDPNRIRCHGQPEYLELGKCLSLFCSRTVPCCTPMTRKFTPKRSYEIPLGLKTFSITSRGNLEGS
ncbi:hypothetical protein THAOC_04480 [Thalassiosira oceanica]|uniref:Uncharacterized protein n=1 Tax=Thalassiosira oceanica TaxID=159749 RepID=K0TJ33_THAOC|nr:hypothetical protein THAOC_04480 [Thalassiosira oceanica]|eukprot:EJK73876.1 hypothetical protein THAOC_04480 [Thalassiosira oceanica]